MKTRTGFSVAVLAAAILLLLPIAPFALAQDNDQDPPTRAGRIGFVQGSVSFQPGGQGTGWRRCRTVHLPRATICGWIATRGRKCRSDPLPSGWGRKRG